MCPQTDLPRILVTGGAGFIGSALIRCLVGNRWAEVVNVDKLTYAGNLSSLRSVESSSLYNFVPLDICDADGIQKLLQEFQPHGIMHLAAETHVDRSIDDPLEFIQTNVMGTANLLQRALEFRQKTGREILFQHISTDEVYGSLGDEGFFTEETAYAPRSPYSSSKAASDHFVRAWYHTYRLPIIISNCSNNYGPCQFPEKLIPLTIIHALEGKQLPIYGNGSNVRDWLYVEDHVKALWLLHQNGIIGETYNIGGNEEHSNLDVVHTICRILDQCRPKASGSYADQIVFVPDRPGHDQRYAIDASKIRQTLQWQPEEGFESGIRKTVQWYLDNKWWWEPIRQQKYAGERLGCGSVK